MSDEDSKRGWLALLQQIAEGSLSLDDDVTAEAKANEMMLKLVPDVMVRCAKCGDQLSGALGELQFSMGYFLAAVYTCRACEEQTWVPIKFPMLVNGGLESRVWDFPEGPPGEA